MNLLVSLVALVVLLVVMVSPLFVGFSYVYEVYTATAVGSTVSTSSVAFMSTNSPSEFNFHP